MANMFFTKSETMGAPFETPRGEFDMTPERQAVLKAAQQEFEIESAKAEQSLPILPIAAGVAGVVVFLAWRKKRKRKQ